MNECMYEGWRNGRRGQLRDVSQGQVTNKQTERLHRRFLCVVCSTLVLIVVFSEGMNKVALPVPCPSRLVNPASFTSGGQHKGRLRRYGLTTFPVHLFSLFSVSENLFRLFNLHQPRDVKCNFKDPLTGVMGYKFKDPFPGVM